MATYSLVPQPITVFTDTNGSPLQTGSIYFGTANQNPQTSPITVYWDVAGTMPASQPLLTTNGYISRQGTPANVYTSSNFSISVYNSQGVLVFNNPSFTVASGITAAAVPLVDSGNYYTGNENVEAALQVLGPLIAEMVTALAAGAVTGEAKYYCGTAAPSGYVLADGNTIGNASSGGTARANADTVNLFTLLWNNYANGQLAIQDSSGSASTRGVSASADYAANKRLPLPDCRGNVLAGIDNMGGTAANRLTVAGAGFDGTIMGNSGGSQTTTGVAAHTHTITDPTHNHTITNGAHSHQFGGLQGVTTGGTNVVSTASGTSNTTQTTTLSNVAASTGVTVNSTGTSTLSVTQPTIIFSVIIKL